ncbi:MAG: type IV pilus assembly protein PilM [Microgenomates group bacterium]
MEIFGLDIGSHTIKLVQLTKKQDKYELIAFHSAETPPRGLNSDAESDLNNLAEIIKKIHQEAKVKTKNVVSALSQDQVYTRLINLPPLSESELESALKWEAEQYVPLPLEEVILSHQVVGKKIEEGKEKIEVILAAAPTRLVEKLIKVLKTAGLTPVSLEMEIAAAARSVVYPEIKRAMLIDLGAKATDLAIIEEGKIALVHSLPTGGEALTRALEFELGLETIQAEAYKKAYGLEKEKLEGKISEAITPVLEKITNEIEKTINFYQSQQKTIDQIILIGGTANLPEISSFMAKKIGLEVQVGNPFARIINSNLAAKISSEMFPLYAVAIGLAMKEI